MGNGAKAQQKRQRKGEKDTGAKSQAKSNEKAKSIICSICKQPFLVTTRAPALEEHSQSRHSKTMAECFPNMPT